MAKIGITVDLSSQNGIVSVQQYYQDLAKNGRLLDYQFQMSVSRPDFGDLQLYGQSTRIPERTVNPASVFYFGQEFELPTTIDEGRRWPVEMFSDKKGEIYDRCLDWQAEYAAWEKSGGGFKGIPNINGYIDLTDHNVSKFVNGFTLVGLWPTRIGDLVLDHSSGKFATFTVDFVFQLKYNSKRRNPIR